MKVRWFYFLIVSILGCSTKWDYKKEYWNSEESVKKALKWMPMIKKSGKIWNINIKLITAIIAVESGGNPNLISKSNAVGLMQIKPSTAGKEVYQHMGWIGIPTINKLKKPEYNISIGTAYLSILKNGILKDIKDPEVMQYALMASYANGAGALLRIFSLNQKKAIEKINHLDKNKFIKYIIKKHPSLQVSRYIWKIQQAITIIKKEIR